MGGSGIRYSVFMCVLESKGVYLCESKTLRYLKYKCIIYKNNSSVLVVLNVYVHFFAKISDIQEKVNTLIKSQNRNQNIELKKIFTADFELPY